MSHLMGRQKAKRRGQSPNIPFKDTDFLSPDLMPQRSGLLALWAVNTRAGVHIYNPSTWQAEPGRGITNVSPAWATQWLTEPTQV